MFTWTEIALEPKWLRIPVHGGPDTAVVVLVERPQQQIADEFLTASKFTNLCERDIRSIVVTPEP